MKKVLKFVASLLLVLSVYKVKAVELTYSEWSTLYPSGLNSSFIESEDRYHFYKFDGDEVEYIDDYYVELEGYIKDEPSRTTFYRYITNNLLFFDKYGDLVINSDDYCTKNFCYFKSFTTPTMIDLSEKQDFDYSDNQMPEVNIEAAPMTGDNIFLSFGLLGCSALLVAILFVLKKKRRVLSK